MVTIKDVALKANVSVATVSYILNDTRAVHPEKRERVLRAINELNYVPNASARGLRAKKTKTIGLVIPDIMNPFYPDLAKGCQDVMKENNYTLVMYNTDNKQNQLEDIVKQTQEGKIDGLILASSIESDIEITEKLVKECYPIVFLHRKLNYLDVDSVTSNNLKGSIEATEHLINYGHKNIAYISGTKGSPVTNDRKQGYIMAMEKAGLSKHIVSGESKYENSYTEALKLLNLPISSRPTAIFAGSDLMALGVMDAAKELNQSIPEDVSVVGYDDLFFSTSKTIQLSTVKIPRYEMGKEAGKLILDKIKNKSKNKTDNINMQTKFIERSTSGVNSKNNM